MQIFAFLPYLVLFPIFFGTARFLLLKSDFYQEAVQLSSQAKYQTLDGLRGLLALSVFFTHAACNYSVLSGGAWESGIYKYLGDAAVWCFFMITGFLFWSKAIAFPRFDIKAFYWNRCVRIFPLYWFSVLLTLGIAIVYSGLSFPNSPLQTLVAVFQWLSCQILPFPIFHGVEQFPDVIGNATWMINGGVAWTLAYELNFYLFFPLLTPLVAPVRFVLLCIGVFALGRFIPDVPSTELFTFLYGMGVAYLFKKVRLENYLSHPVFAGIALASLWLGGARFLPDKISALLVCAAFVIILYGNEIFGWLTSKPFRFLGLVSFDFYLLHSMVIYIVFRFVHAFIPFQTISPVLFWMISALCGAISVFVSGLTYRYVSYPFLQKKQSQQTVPVPVIKEQQLK